MKFNFGENLKSLRKDKGFTQEEVAEFLNVSTQSVSRWENNVTYPDISLLPIIASFFQISIDSLFGVDDEQISRLKQEYYNRRNLAHKKGDIHSAYEISQELLNLFPSDKSVISCAMTDSYLMGFHNYDNRREQYLKNSILISKRFLKLYSDIEEQCRAIKNISTCYKLLDDKENALIWLNKLPTVWNSIENAILSVYDNDSKKSDAIKSSFDGVIHLLYRMIYALALEQENKKDKIDLLKKIPELFDLIFENRDYGFYNAFLSATYFKIAEIFNDKDKTQLYIQKSMSCAKAYDNSVLSNHSSLLLNGIAINPDEWTSASSLSQEEQLLNKIKSAGFNFEIEI